jgi:hypothetical protein
VAGANMNCRYLRLAHTSELLRSRPKTFALKSPTKSQTRTPQAAPLGVFDNLSHSGKKMGIMRSVQKKRAKKTPIVREILQCLQVNDAQAYLESAERLGKLTEEQQAGKRRFSMLIFNIHDEVGNRFAKDDFDVYLLAGKKYNPNALPKGFFQDRQMNARTSNLVYYLNADRMGMIKDGLFGVRVVARPTSGFSHYAAAEYRSAGFKVENILAPNQTTYVDIELRRLVDKNVFRFDRASRPSGSFKRIRPSGDVVA